jgi:hypothetical protein
MEEKSGSAQLKFLIFFYISKNLIRRIFGVHISKKVVLLCYHKTVFKFFWLILKTYTYNMYFDLPYRFSPSWWKSFVFLLKWLNFELNDNKEGLLWFFWHIFHEIQWLPNFFWKTFSPFFWKNIIICIRYYWLNPYLLQNSTTG